LQQALHQCFFAAMHLIFLYTHIIAGSLALLAGPFSMFNQTGNSMHRFTGRIFFYAMTVVFITSVYLSIAGNIPFLLMIGIFSYHSIAVAYRALSLKRKGAKAGYADWLISSTALLFNLAMLVTGVITLAEEGSFGIVLLAFGAFGSFSCLQTMRRYASGYQDKNGWLYTHISGMCGGYIATLTAFLVNTVHFLPPVMLWLGPSVILTPYIIVTLRKFRSGRATIKSEFTA
jgi:uncharacterized membrane protein